MTNVEEPQTDRFERALQDGYIMGPPLTSQDAQRQAWMVLTDRNGIPFVCISSEPEGILVTAHAANGIRHRRALVRKIERAAQKATAGEPSAIVEPLDGGGGFMAGPLDLEKARLLASKICRLTGVTFPIKIDEKGIIR